MGGCVTTGGCVTGGGEGGAVTHPAIVASIAAARRTRRANGLRSREAVGWLLLEVLVALFIAAAIVMWTMGPKRRKPPREPTNDTGNDRR